MLSGSLDDGRRYAERALELEPDYGQAFLMLGTVSRFKSDWDQALEYYRLAQKKDVSDDSCNQLTNACMQRWQTTYTKRFKAEYAKEALRTAKTWRVLSPRSPLPYLKLASVYTMLGRTDDARKLLKKGLAAEMSPLLPRSSVRRGLVRLFWKSATTSRKAWTNVKDTSFVIDMIPGIRPPISGGSSSSGKCDSAKLPTKAS